MGYDAVNRLGQKLMSPWLVVVAVVFCTTTRSGNELDNVV